VGSSAKEDDQAPKEHHEAGFAQKLIERVVHNLQVYLNEIHIRYEDAANSMSFGLTLELLHAFTTDTEGHATFLSEVGKVVHKAVRLKNLAVYWDNDSPPLTYRNSDELSQQLSDLIYREDGKHGGGKHRYLIEPISGQLRAVINTSDLPDLEQPKLVLQAQIDNIWLTLNEEQFKTIQQFADMMVKYFQGRR
jgi:vacuolar protein sorting-associated protein 13A/C